MVYREQSVRLCGVIREVELFSSAQAVFQRVTSKESVENGDTNETGALVSKESHVLVRVGSVAFGQC